MKNKIQVSFIIPAYNEERFLEQTLERITTFIPKSISFEIIVADNGSEDGTVDIAKKHAKVFVNDRATVGGLRNLAVESSRGEVIVFLDADVLLTDNWGHNFLSTYESLLARPYQVTGSRCAIPETSSWIENAWFQPLITQPSNYINSGHLITTRKLFDKINGFDVTLEAGEDYAFGQSALSVRADIVNNTGLEVVHEGYPKSLLAFIRREIWHGAGDVDSLKSLLASKVAQIALVFLFLHLVLGFSVVNENYVTAMISLSFIILLCFAATIFKHKVRSLRGILQVAFLYYFYFIARFLSWVPHLNKRDSRRGLINI